MPTIVPVSDLRDYNKVLEKVTPTNPVFLTKNGRGKFMLVDLESERAKQEQWLMEELERAERRIANGEKGLTMGELEDMLETWKNQRKS